MHPLLLSGLVANGILRKGDRVLFFCGGNTAGYEWLQHRRFRVEEMNAASPYSSPALCKYTLHEVVLAETSMEPPADPEVNFGNWREALRHVRPGGILLLFLRYNRPDNTTDLHASAHLASCFSGSPIASLDALENTGPEPGRLYRIKKGGAYIPRLPVKYIDTSKQFEHVCEQFAARKCVGLDVETTLREPRILCTLQLATESSIYLVDTLAIKDLAPLKQVMESPNVLKIIHNKNFESSVLKQYGIEIHNVYDTCIASRKKHKNEKGPLGHRLSDVCERELGLYLDKSLQTSDWTQRPLTPEQCNYAAADAEVLIRLYHVFSPPEPPTTGELF